MSEGQVAKRHVTPPSWLTRPDGKKRQLERAQWSMQRITEVFIDEPETHFTVDDLARLVYGHASKKNRENVRKHIPMQRTHMLALMTPIITRYGARGRIVSVKLYQKDALEDRRSMQEELDRLLARKELTDERYDAIRDFLGLA